MSHSSVWRHGATTRAKSCGERVWEQRRTDIPHFTALDKVVKSFHGFFDGDGCVETVDLKDIEVVGLQAGEGGVDGGEDGLAG